MESATDGVGSGALEGGAGSDVDGVGSGVLEGGGGSEDEGGGSVSEGEGVGSGVDGEGLSVEIGGEVPGGGGAESEDEEGGGVSTESAGRATVTPLTTAETEPSRPWPRIRTSLPIAMKGNQRQSDVTKESGFTYQGCLRSRHDDEGQEWVVDTEHSASSCGRQTS